MPSYRYFGNWALTYLTRLASGYWHISDSQCGYTAIHRRMLARLDLGKIYARYGFPNDLLIHLNILRARVTDVPVRPIYGDETSGIRLHKVIPRILHLLAAGGIRRLWWKYFRSRKAAAEEVIVRQIL
ncbi:hypothetical protein ACFL54_04375 [Planctomycetota bacterium]